MSNTTGFYKLFFHTEISLFLESWRTLLTFFFFFDLIFDINPHGEIAADMLLYLKCSGFSFFFKDTLTCGQQEPRIQTTVVHG